MKIVLLEDLGVPDRIIEKHASRLKKMGHEFRAYPKNADVEVQLDRSRDADVIMIANMPLNAEVVKAAESLKYIDVAFTGVDHIPMDEVKKRGIAVSNASGYATQAVTELCITYMIQLLRNISKTEERCRHSETKEGLIGHLLCGKTVGIVGAGAIGRRVAALCKAFGCNVIACSRSKVDDPSIDVQISLEDLLKRADIVSLHCPLTNETQGLIGEKELKLMKDNSILVNTARGKVIDNEALAAALEAGKIGGAACDVFDMEPPLPADYPLLHSPNTIVTPHIGFASVESMELRAEIVFENLYSWLDGKHINQIG